MSNKTTIDADGHPTYEHRGKHSRPDHHVGPCGPSCRAGRKLHRHRKSGEKMTPAVARRIYTRYYNRDRRRGRSRAYAEREAHRIEGAIIRRAGKLSRDRASRRR